MTCRWVAGFPIKKAREMVDEASLGYGKDDFAEVGVGGHVVEGLSGVVQGEDAVDDGFDGAGGQVWEDVFFELAG